MNVTIRAWPIALIIALGISACADIPIRMHDSGVRIEPVSNATGTIRSAGFWTDKEGISLRGEAAPPSADADPMSGHIDIAITVPDGSRTVCTIAPLTADRRYGGNTYAHRFAALPPRGSVVRVWHHASASHQGCSG